jgi:hypothetical protein
MNKQVEVKQAMNGFQVTLKDEAQPKPYVFASTQEHTMIEKIGEFLLGYKIVVTRK